MRWGRWVPKCAARASACKSPDGHAEADSAIYLGAEEDSTGTDIPLDRQHHDILPGQDAPLAEPSLVCNSDGSIRAEGCSEEPSDLRGSPLGLFDQLRTQAEGRTLQGHDVMIRDLL